MAGLSIRRRQKAWLKGVAFGALRVGRCQYSVPKLKELFERGAQHAAASPESPYVRAVVDQENRKRRPRARVEKPRAAFDRRRPQRPQRFERPERPGGNRW
jgi:hypothetical protein